MSDFSELSITQQPNSKGAESGVIGSVLVYPAAYQEAKKYLVKDDFYVIRNSWIFEAFEKLAANHTQIDLVTVSEYLESQNRLTEIGGQNYLLGLINDTPTALHVEDYAKVVLDMATRRRAIQAANNLAKLAYDMATPIEESIPNHFVEVTKLVKAEGKIFHISHGLSVLYDDVEKRSKNPQEIYGIPFGIKTIDEITGGLQKGELTVLSGEPGLGKSVLGLQFAFCFGKAGHPGAIFELEMSATQTLRRSLSVESKVPVRTMKTGTVLPDQWDNITRTIEEMAAYPIYFSDSTSWTTASLRSELTRLKQINGIEWFLVDYLGLLRDRFEGKDYERIGHITEELHHIVKDLDLAGIAIQSMTKQGFKEGGMSGVYGGAGLHHGADLICTLENTGQNTLDNCPIVNLVYSKNREGDTGKNLVRLVKGAHFPSFTEYKKF